MEIRSDRLYLVIKLELARLPACGIWQFQLYTQCLANPQLLYLEVIYFLVQPSFSACLLLSAASQVFLIQNISGTTLKKHFLFVCLFFLSLTFFNVHTIGKGKKYQFSNQSQQWLGALQNVIFVYQLFLHCLCPEESIIWSFKKGVRERSEE